MGEPSSSNVLLLSNLTGIPPTEALKWLKAHNNDVNAATNAYLDNPNSLQDQPSYADTWNESQFHQDKTDIAQPGHQQPCKDPWEELEAFAIAPQDTLNPSVFDAGPAPSRPPSRVSTRAGMLVDHVGGTQRQLTYAEQDEQQMQQALEMSMSQTIPGQESGVTNASDPYFGPANREHYDNGNWTMTAIRSNTKEILPDPEPEDRRREINTPAFLKPSADRNRLSALIKILQTIPMSREALLNRENTIRDYGHDSEWWDGSAIKAPRTINVAQAGQYPQEEELIHETQRLVAFLEETERAYGSVESLLNVEGINRSGNDQLLARYLERWRAITAKATPNYALLNVFQSTGIKNQGTEPWLEEKHDFQVLELRIDEVLADRGHTLYDAIDDILWADENESSFENIYISQLGEIFIVDATCVTETASGLGIRIPPVWYSDRYLKSSIPQTKEMKAGKAEVKKEIQRIHHAEEQIRKLQSSASVTTAIDPTELLNTTMAFFQRSALLTDSSKNVTDDVEQKTPMSQGPNRYSRTADRLKCLTAMIQTKIERLEESRKHALEKFDELSKLYTKPAQNPADPPNHKYTLRGVCANPNTVYVLEKTQPDDENDILSTEANDWQWWKISYMSSDWKPILYTLTLSASQQQKVREIEVLKAAKSESRSALLVYASEEAVSYEVADLPSQLRNFVRLDNLSFTAELDKSALPKPLTPIKRKADDGENDDLVSNFYRSPPQEQSTDLPQSTSSSDPTLPAYTSPSPSPPFSPSWPSQASGRILRNAKTYDDLIPISLRATGPTIDQNSMLLDPEDVNQGGKEMEDRGGGIGMLQTRNGQLDSEYTIGSYVPEISMEDGEDEQPGKSKHIEYTNGGPEKV